MCLINDDDDISLFFQLKPKKSFPLMNKENREREREREREESETQWVLIGAKVWKECMVNIHEGFQFFK